MSKALDSGKTFIDAVLAKLPENLRADAAKAFAAPEAADALTTLGDGVLARSDYSRQMDDLKAKETQLVTDYENLTAWYDQNKATLEKASTLEAEIARLQGQKPTQPVITPVASKEPPVAGLSKEDVETLLSSRDQNYAAVLALSNRLTAEHLKNFNEVLDLQELIQHAQTKQVNLLEAYKQVHAEQLTAKAKADEDARISKLVEERLGEERKKFTDQPYPIRNASPSVLDVIETKGDPSKHTIDSALAEYERLQAARG